ncbi:hypothetical protein BDFB_008246 [Asbolus verrucosus]|uniref:Uncharacterized protein n=1 Tax=Asbolus verrucosus TaxID=1661398 RepID=A0A482VPP7_ASBVE|nr:hypothetical protein BDFB_008246 [Asbolus verrucosus]
MLTTTILSSLLITNLVLCIPPNDKALFGDDPESRHRKRGRPCRGRSNPQGRTFFDWSFQHIDVNYNYNYNINCGGGGGGVQHEGGNGGGPNKPILQGILQGINNRPPGEGLFGPNGPFTFVQSQVQNIVANGQGLGSLLPEGGIFNGEGLGSLLPEGGLFNGQGISSLFENGLFSNIFNRPPSPPPGGPSYEVTTAKPDGQDPDDIIYNDEKPVHEDHDDVVPDNYNRPGQYIVASNPIFGQHVYDLPDFNPNKAIRQFNRELNRFARPVAHLFGR